jgi:hypothetical protein
MYQIMKITIYLLISFMLMGIEGCPSDQLASNEACSGQAPAFRLSVVSNTEAPFSIAIDSVGTAVHKTTKQRTQFNPITGVGPKFNMRISTKENTLGSIYDSTFRPTDIHKNKGCIKEYTVSASVTGQWLPKKKQPNALFIIDPENPTYSFHSTMELTQFTNVKPLLDSAPERSYNQYVCKAPEGKQIKTCTFTLNVGQEAKTASFRGSRQPGVYSWFDYYLIRPMVGSKKGVREISQSATFANE